MKVVVIGGTGLIGSKVVAKLGEHGHEALAASPASGVDTLTGAGLDKAMEGASVVVDVSNSPSFADADVMTFFTTSTGNLLAAEREAGVGHHVALSVVGTERLPESGYMRAKVAQEALIRESAIPYSIVHATQFFEFLRSIADGATTDGVVRLPHVLFQPMAADDVAKEVAWVAANAPLNGTLEIAGPDLFWMDEFLRRGLKARNDPREVVTDSHARYFGAELAEHTLLPAGREQIGETSFEVWSGNSAPRPAASEQTSGALPANALPTSSSPPLPAYTPMVDWQDDPR